MKSVMQPPILSIVIPCYNEKEAFSYCFEALTEVIKSLIKKEKISKDSNLLFIDDGSTDGTWELIRNSFSDVNIKGVRLSRNFGHQAALMAGLSESDADIVVSIDADLQDDVGCIEKMIDSYSLGNDIVYGVRENRASDKFFKRNTANLFYKIMNKMGVEQVENHADFRLMSRRALKVFLTLKERNLYIRGMIPLIGFKNDKVYYSRVERIAGETHYPFKKMVSLAVKGITSSSVHPLRIIFYTGFIISMISFLMILYSLVQKFFGNTIEGWASLSLIILFLGGVQMLCLGVIGEYIGKIYTEVKGRPIFIVSEKTDNDAKKMGFVNYEQ